MASATNLQEIERRLIVEGSNTKPEKDALKDYFADYQCQEIEDYYLDQKTRRIRAVIVFPKPSSVKSVMSDRPHRIDGEEVAVYRLIPDQESNKRKQGIETLIVSGIENSSLSQSDIERYFRKFGEIDLVVIEAGENSCCVKFKDYDSVDQALLDVPHVIRNVSVDIHKGDRINRAAYPNGPVLRRNFSCTNISDLGERPTPKQVQTNFQTAFAHDTNTKYCVYITNLPANVTAEDLAEKFHCSTYNLVMSSVSDGSSEKRKCWLRDIAHLKDAENFVRSYHQMQIFGSTIQCKVEQNKEDCCNDFRLGQCKRPQKDCHRAHIKCSANGKCPVNCPYGHEKGMKGIIPKSELNESYQLKISGLPRDLSHIDLARKIDMKENNVRVDTQSQTGYAFRINTFSFARQLLRKWHNQDMGNDHPVKCQIELVQKPSPSKARRHEIKLTSESSTSRDDERTEPRTVDDLDINYEGRLFSQCYDSLIKQKEADDQREPKKVADASPSHVPDPKAQSLLDMRPNAQKTDKKRTEDDRHMFELRKRMDHDSLAYLVEYDANEEKYQKELKALKMLKGVQGVVQLIELENQSDNIKKQHSDRYEYHLVTERPSGDLLKDFVTTIHRNGFTVLEAIQLVQNLLAIAQRVHLHGVLHRNLEPETIIIKWDSKRTSMDEAVLVLINFSQAHFMSDEDNRGVQSTGKRWYRPPQLDVKSFKFSTTIDASSICAILFWLLTSIEPQCDTGLLPHEQQEAKSKISRKVAEALRCANSNQKLTSTELQLKTYLIDTFNTAFGYPRYQPWTITGLACRLESIRELLLPRNPKIDTMETAFQELLSASVISASPLAVIPGLHHDLFQRAADTLKQAKTTFSQTSHLQFSWSDGNCTWLDDIRSAINERRHDDILTYFTRNRHHSNHYSIIVTCFAAVDDRQKVITISMGSPVNGRMCRVPIGRYSQNEDFTKECEHSFMVELKNLIISICKEWHTT